MASELIVAAFPHRTEAGTVLDALRSMRKAPVLELENAVVVSRKPDGTVALHREEVLSSGRSGEDRVLLKSFARLLWGAGAEGAADARVCKGMDEHFVRETVKAMKDNGSAVLILARPGDVHDADETINVLALFRGKICRTTLTPEAEAFLLEKAGAGEPLNSG